MIRLAHLSDLHFGAEDPLVVEALVADLRAQAPALVAVSGDLTQRARRREFEAARAFLDALPAPTLCVPGNHDMPLFQLWRRFRSPFARYRALVTPDLCPFVRLEGLCALGLNTARRLTLKEGRVNEEQRALVARSFRDVPPGAWRVIVTHHPFVLEHEEAPGELVANATEAIRAVEALSVDLVLSGHLHRAFHADAAAFHPTERGAVLVVQCGTSVSRRRRGEPNAWNLLHLGRDSLTLEVRAFDGTRFVRERSVSLPRQAGPSRRRGGSIAADELGPPPGPLAPPDSPIP